MELCNCS